MQPRIKNLRQHTIFKSIAAVLLLSTFVLAITPKLVLHDLVAAHRDQPSKKTGKELQISEAGFHCDCTSIVATSPFAGISETPGIAKFVLFSSTIESISVSFSSPDRFYFSLRGPPVIFS